MRKFITVAFLTKKQTIKTCSVLRWPWLCSKSRPEDSANCFMINRSWLETIYLARGNNHRNKSYWLNSYIRKYLDFPRQKHFIKAGFCFFFFVFLSWNISLSSILRVKKSEIYILSHKTGCEKRCTDEANQVMIMF